MVDGSTSKQHSRDYFDWLASQYDNEGIYEMCKEDYPAILDELEREPCKDVLDCGCGSGAILALLHATHPEMCLQGIDLSPFMIETAKKRGLEDVPFVIGDCEDLPFADCSFDTVICSHSFHHYPNVQLFFDSVARVLRPNGRLILRDNTGPWWWLIKMNLYAIPKGNRKYHMGDIKFYSEREVGRLCRKAGLSLERFEERGTHKMHCVVRKPF